MSQTATFMHWSGLTDYGYAFSLSYKSNRVHFAPGLLAWNAPKVAKAQFVAVSSIRLVPVRGGVFMSYGLLSMMEDSDEDFYALQQATRPSLILPDLKDLPGKDGHTILKQIKQDTALCNIPVVILSTSNNPTDIKDCYATCAVDCVIKPLTYDHLRKALQNICTYWFHTVALPDRMN
jgi:CheY-like chemotaxis protein